MFICTYVDQFLVAVFNVCVLLPPTDCKAKQSSRTTRTGREGMFSSVLLLMYLTSLCMQYTCTYVCCEPDEYIMWYPLLLQYQECDKVVSEYKELMEKARLKAEQEEKERKGAIKVSFLHVSDLQCVHHIIHVLCVQTYVHVYMYTGYT